MSLKRTLERLRPYPSLLMLALPAAVVEPLKLVAVAVAGKGHWITGTAMIVACYAFSLLVIERLFVVVKPKLLTIAWFATLWERFVAVRKRMLGLFRLSRPHRDRMEVASSRLRKHEGRTAEATGGRLRHEPDADAA